MRGYRIFPESLVGVVAAALPYLEIALGVLLLVGLATRLAAVLSAVVLVAFIAGVISAAARGLSIDCGCFGGGGDVGADQTAYTAEILRDLGFLALAGYLIFRPDTPLVDRSAGRRRSGRTGIVVSRPAGQCAAGSPGGRAGRKERRGAGQRQEAPEGSVRRIESEPECARSAGQPSSTKPSAGKTPAKAAPTKAAPTKAAPTKAAASRPPAGSPSPRPGSHPAVPTAPS